MNIAIVGAGVMGQLLALTFIKDGHAVSIYEQDHRLHPTNCSMAAAGLLTPLAELEKTDLIIFHLGDEALQKHWPAILKQLNKKMIFKHQGSFVVSHPRDKADLIRFISMIEMKYPKDFSFYQRLDQAALAQFEPEIAKFDEAYYLANEGYLDNQTLLKKLKAHLLKANLDWHHNTRVDDTAPGKIKIKEQTFEFDWVFDCRGLGAKKIFPQLQGIRGELIWLHAPDVNIQHPIRFLHPRYGLYIVPRGNHRYIIGASEIPAEDMSPISVKSVLELLSAAYYLHPGFAEARILKTVTHLRPTLPSYKPAIKYQEKYLAVNGLYRHGFLIAPTLAHEIQQFFHAGFSAVRYPELWEKIC